MSLGTWTTKPDPVDSGLFAAVVPAVDGLWLGDLRVALDQEDSKTVHLLFLEQWYLGISTQNPLSKLKIFLGSPSNLSGCGTVANLSG